MGYTPTNWATGDVITAEKLNNMESGIVGAGKGFFVIHATGVADPQNTTTQPTLDKTFAEISAAYQSGLMPVILGSQTRNGQPIGEAVVPFSGRSDIEAEQFIFINTSMASGGGSFYLTSVMVIVTAEMCASTCTQKVLE